VAVPKVINEDAPGNKFPEKFPPLCFLPLTHQSIWAVFMVSKPLLKTVACRVDLPEQ